MKLSFVILFFALSNYSHSQQPLNGRWIGRSEHSILVLNPTQIIMEMETINDSLILGVIHSYYKKGRFEHIKISGNVNWKDSTITISEENEISHNINTKLFDLCLGVMKLKLSAQDKKYKLEGTWRDKSRKLFRCPTLSVWFEKDHLIQGTMAEKEYRLPSRITDIQKVVELSSNELDSIKCSIYDNGEIDNDTASVYFNDSLVLHAVRLSQMPIIFYLSLDRKRRIQKITLIAENLGSIPPNTALLVIATKKNHYTVTLSSDFSKNGAVEFFLKE